MRASTNNIRDGGEAAMEPHQLKRSSDTPSEPVLGGSDSAATLTDSATLPPLPDHDQESLDAKRVSGMDSQ